ncbi:hypothetical protein [Streptomyces sp. NPDC051014]|uniref:hypothetical protein n=1 Tax=Streptomyces sp. NPDC051014 TaxID=3155751 RepID=UPI0033C253FC
MSEMPVAPVWDGASAGPDWSWLYTAAAGLWEQAAQVAQEAPGWTVDAPAVHALVELVGQQYGFSGSPAEEVAGELVSLAEAGRLDDGVFQAYYEALQRGEIRIGSHPLPPGPDPYPPAHQYEPRHLMTAREQTAGAGAGPADGFDAARECLAAMSGGDWDGAVYWAGMGWPGAAWTSELLREGIDLTERASGLSLPPEPPEAAAAALRDAAEERPGQWDIWREKLAFLATARSADSDAGATVLAQAAQPEWGKNPGGRMPGDRPENAQQVDEWGTRHPDVAEDAGMSVTREDSSHPNAANLHLRPRDREILGAVFHGRRTISELATLFGSRPDTVYALMRLGTWARMQDTGAQAVLNTLLRTLPLGEGIWADVITADLPRPGEGAARDQAWGPYRTQGLTAHDRETLGAIAHGHHTIDGLAKALHEELAHVQRRLTKIGARTGIGSVKSQDILDALVDALPKREKIWAIVDVKNLPTPAQSAARAAKRKVGIKGPSAGDREILGAITHGHLTVPDLATVLGLEYRQLQTRLNKLAARAGMAAPNSEKVLEDLLADLPAGRNAWAGVDIDALPEPTESAAKSLKRTRRTGGLTEGDREILGAIKGGSRSFDDLVNINGFDQASAKQRLVELGRRAAMSEVRYEKVLDRLLMTWPRREGVWANVEIDLLPTPKPPPPRGTSWKRKK